MSSTDFTRETGSAGASGIATPLPVTPHVSLGLLGEFTVKSADGQDVTPSSKKACCLLAYLALSPGLSAPRKTLAALLWCDQDEERARASLRQCIRQVRSALAHAVDEADVDLLLIANRNSVSLNQALVDIDAQKISGNGLLHRDTRAAQLSLWRGEALQNLECSEDPFDDWVTEQRNALLLETISLLETALGRSKDDAAEALDIAENLLHFDPCHEVAAERVIALSLAAGDRRRAQQCYRSLERAMSMQLDMSPGAEVTSLYEAMRQSTPAEATSRELTGTPDKPNDPVSPETLPGEWRQRHRTALVNKVSSFWIDGLLAQSLKLHRVINLELREEPAAVYLPWRSVLRRPEPPQAQSYYSADIARVYEEADHSLLILGAPGAGKTTLLLQLASALLDRARRDSGAPVPVVFHLVTWVDSDGDIAEWIVDELNKRYGVPPALGRQVLDHDILPLFDGLDEVPTERQVECITAINDFIARRIDTQLVVCSRAVDYDLIGTRLKLNKAVGLQPISPQQQEALGNSGELQGLDHLLQQDASLRELLSTPLMVDVVSEVLPDIGPEDRQSPARFRERMFSTYVDKMLGSDDPAAGVDTGRPYSAAESKRYLSWLAKRMLGKSQGVFYLEWMQPDWLDPGFGRWCVSAGSIMILGVMFGVFLGVYSAAEYNQWINLPIAVIGSIIASFGAASMDTGKTIRPGSRVRFSIDFSRQPIGRKIVQALITALVVFLTFGYLTTWTIGIVTAIPLGFTFFFVSILESHFTTSGSSARSQKPNAGMRRSLVNFLGVSVVTGVFFAVLATWLGGLSAGIFIGLVLGMIMGLNFGGHPVLQHYLLRFFLWRGGHAPWRYVHFLDDCVNRILLYPVGGGYLFTHRTLMEYFAHLDAQDEVSGS